MSSGNKCGGPRTPVMSLSGVRLASDPDVRGGESMTRENLHLTPEESFPEHLEKITDQELQVLDSQVQRQISQEIVTEGEANPESEFRRYELDEEFENRAPS